MDAGFYSADYLRAWIRSAQLRAHLIARGRRGLVAQPRDRRAAARPLPRGHEADERGDRRAPGLRPARHAAAAARNRRLIRHLDVEPTPERQRPPRPKRAREFRAHARSRSARVAVLADRRAGAARRRPARGPRREQAAAGHDRRHADARTSRPSTLRSRRRRRRGSSSTRPARSSSTTRRSPATAGTKLVPEVADVAAGRLRRPADVHVPRSARLALQRRLAGHRGVVRARARARALAGARLAGRHVSARGALAGSADGRTLTIRLRTPAPDFVQRLALPYFCAVPSTRAERADATTCRRPARSRSRSYTPRPLAAAASGTRTTDGPRRTHVDAILYRFGAFPSQIRLQLERGEADYGVVTPTSFAELAAKFKGDKTHLFVVQQPIVAYLALNTQRPLFKDNPQLRRAVNYALDRPILARPLRRATARSRTTSTCRPGFPGYQAKHVYPVGGPDLATARRLAQGHLRGGHATFLACGSQSCVDRALVVARTRCGKIGLQRRASTTSPGVGQLDARRRARHEVRHRRRDHAARLRRPVRARRQAARQPRDPRRSATRTSPTSTSPQLRPRDRRGAAADGRRPRPRLRPARARGRADRRRRSPRTRC